MKTIYLIRHAKSDWAVPADDIDRPLNDRGKQDAPKMAERLKDRHVKIDAFVSSPAKRALKTAQVFAETFHRKKEDIIQVPELYLPPASKFYTVIGGLSDKYSSAAIFSHNNGITDFANMLDVIRVDNMPTCSIFAVRARTDEWKDFEKAQKEFLFFDYPRKHDHT